MLERKQILWECYSCACRQAKNCKSNLIIVGFEFSLSMKLAFSLEHLTRRRSDGETSSVVSFIIKSQKILNSWASATGINRLAKSLRDHGASFEKLFPPQDMENLTSPCRDGWEITKLVDSRHKLHAINILWTLKGSSLLWKLNDDVLPSLNPF